MVKKNAWTKEEDRILMQYYPEEGASVSERLPRRSVPSCRARAHRIGISSGAVWSEEEIEILKKYYPQEGMRVSKRLPRRIGDNCKEKANKLGLKKLNRHPWTAQEDIILKQYFPLEGRSVSKRLAGRNGNDCGSRASYLGIKCIKGNWTKNEIAILRQYYPTEGPNVYRRLPGRSRKSCQTKYSRLNVSIGVENVSIGVEFEIIKKYEDWDICFWHHNNSKKIAFVRMVNSKDYIFMAAEDTDFFLETKWYRNVQNREGIYEEISKEKAQLLLTAVCDQDMEENR